MNFKELLEGAEPKMPGAPSGIKIMTPQQFVAKSGDMPDEKDEELKEFAPYDHNDDGDYDDEDDDELRSLYDTKAELEAELDYADEEDREHLESELDDVHARIKALKPDATLEEGQEHLDRIRKLSGLDEATKLPASTRDLGGQEFQDYMKRIVGTPDIDKKTGQVKIDKKGNEKYVSGKTKGDKYKMPYIHRSSVITYMSPDGQTFDEDAVKKTLAIRPKTLLKQNEKMKHSNGEFEQFFNVGFAALVGLALDEQTNNLIVVNTCPGAGSCKVDCFAMKGGKIQFQGPWQSDGRILTYLLNDPDGFFNQLSSEISAEASAGAKGDKKFPKGWQTTIRWHDAGDFFSPEYLDMALKMAAKHPDVRFYAYTKMAGAALAQKPSNFIINWSEGAHTSQEKQVKAKDANLDTTKNSRIVPDDMFQDLLVKDQKGNLVKGDAGQWQVQSDKLPELKQRLAKEYGISANSILSYDEYMAKRKSIPAGMKYNVIVAPGEGDISANDPNIVSTLLLRH
jgi:Gene product 88